MRELAALGTAAAAHGTARVFWSGLIGGWLIALVAWLVSASFRTVGQVMVVWFLTFVVGLTRLAHAVATTAEVMAATLTGDVTAGGLAAWFAPAVLGNVVGGVFFVTLLNYGQVQSGSPKD